MKKLLIFAITVASVLLLLTSCSDPVKDELTDFVNVQMAEINENYEAITEELAKWETFATDEEWIVSLRETLIPKCDEILKKLSEIEPTTEEIKAIKAMFTTVIEKYKDGFTKMLAGVCALDENLMTEGSDLLEKGMEALSEYNGTLESLASRFGIRVEY